MRIIKRILKVTGLVLLPIIVIVALFASSVFFLNKELVSNNIHETREKFGDFRSEQRIKLIEIGSAKKFISGTLGQLLPEKFGLGYLNKVRIFPIAYKSADLIVTGIMITPKTDGKFPCVIFNRGGSRDFGRLSIVQIVLHMAAIASNGYVVIASNYRGNGGSEGTEEFGGSDVKDVLTLIPALSQVELADTSRIGMIGLSRGGMMTYKSLRETNQIKAAIVISGTNNLLRMKTDRPEMEQHVFSELIPDYFNNADESLKDRSVVYWVNDLDKTAPLMIFHGMNDRRVNYIEAEQLVDSLVRYAHPHLFVSAENDGHGLMDNLVEVRRLYIQWLDNYVRDLKPFEESQQMLILK